MSSSEQKIKDMLKKVSKRKTELAELQGEKKQIQKQMFEEGCETAEDLEKQIKKEERQIVKIEKEIVSGVKSLEEDYDWS